MSFTIAMMSFILAILIITPPRCDAGKPTCRLEVDKVDLGRGERQTKKGYIR